MSSGLRVIEMDEDPSQATVAVSIDCVGRRTNEIQHGVLRLMDEIDIDLYFRSL
jgi:hypothetical protein